MSNATVNEPITNHCAYKYDFVSLIPVAVLVSSILGLLAKYYVLNTIEMYTNQRNTQNYNEAAVRNRLVYILYKKRQVFYMAKAY